MEILGNPPNWAWAAIGMVTNTAENSNHLNSFTAALLDLQHPGCGAYNGRSIRHPLRPGSPGPRAFRIRKYGRAVPGLRAARIGRPVRAAPAGSPTARETTASCPAHTACREPPG